MTTLLFFSSPHCSVCHALQPKLQEAVQKQHPNIPFKLINVVEDPLSAAQNTIFTLPAVLIFYNQREQFRFARSFSIQQVLDALSKINPEPLF